MARHITRVNPKAVARRSSRKGRSPYEIRVAIALPSSVESATVSEKPNKVVPILPPSANDHLACESQEAIVVARLVFLCRVRTQIQQAMLRFGNQLAAMDRLRTGELKGKVKAKRIPTSDDIAVAVATQEHLAPFIQPLTKQLREEEKKIATLAKELPAWIFWESIRGCGALGLGLIVGSCGDLSNYANPGKLWKRMGLALVGTERQRRVSDTEQALLHGYNPRRRSLMHVVGDSLLKGNRDGYYRGIYDARKLYTVATHPDWTKAHRHMDAMRYMEKRLLRHLWQVWRKQAGGVTKPVMKLPVELDAEAISCMNPMTAVPQHPAML